jgi:uncharacterized protein
MLKGTAVTAATAGSMSALGIPLASSVLRGSVARPGSLPHARPAVGHRRFVSRAVDVTIHDMQGKIADPNLAILFENCFPNTLDTTVWTGSFEGKPDTYVVTGDIDAMWLRDSSAQVWPYLALVKEDEKLRVLVEGLIRRQGRMIRIDPYANAFTRDPGDPPLKWAVADKTEHKPGVAERKWEIDSLCYPIRLAHGYWRTTGDTAPFDSAWKETARTILRTFREQQRKDGHGPYSFQREAAAPTDTLPLGGFGNPARPVGLIHSMFRPSDDACIFPLFIPANLFAVVSLRQLAELSAGPLNDPGLAEQCKTLADEVERTAIQYGQINDPKLGRIWAYEVDGFGNTLRMDDSNAPGLTTLPYLGYCRADDPLYLRTRAFTLSPDNPYFFRGKAAEGIGGPHIGLNYVWPMGILFRALTSLDVAEIRTCLRWLRDTTADRGFMHESFHCDNPADFTRPWFAWANTLFGELILKLRRERPGLLAAPLG